MITFGTSNANYWRFGGFSAHSQAQSSRQTGWWLEYDKYQILCLCLSVLCVQDVNPGGFSAPSQAKILGRDKKDRPDLSDPVRERAWRSKHFSWSYYKFCQFVRILQTAFRICLPVLRGQPNYNQRPVDDVETLFQVQSE